MRTTSWLLATALLSAPLIAQQGPTTYVKDAQGWLRIEDGRSFRVDDAVVSARFHAPAPALSELLAGLDGPAAGLTVVRTNRLGVTDLALPRGADPLDVVAALRASGLVDFAEENTFGSYTATPDDTSFGSQWNLHNVGQTGGTAGADVGAVEAWDIEDGDPSVVVAVLDSGTEWSHPDLAANIWNNGSEIPGNGIDDDGNGFIDDIRGWDFDAGDNDPSGSFFHGTSVASVVGAVGNNGNQIVGLAGGGADGVGCRIMPCNVGNFAPNASVLDDAIIYAADNGAKVITMSLTVPSSQAIIDACDYAWNTAGCFVDNAAGNSFGGSVGFPGTLPTVMAVASTDHNDLRSSFGSVGPEVEISAPGSSILMLNVGGGTTVSDGTSFASPHVAALAALMWSANPTLDNDTIRSVMRATADDVGPAGYDTGTGDGRINAFSALSAVATGFVQGKVIAYGTGLAGGSGAAPLLATLGGAPPVKGKADFAVTLRQAAPAVPAFLVLGTDSAALPFKGGTLLVDVSGPSWTFLDLTTTPQGNGAVSLPIPDDDALVGLSFFAQWAVLDPGAPQGWALSQGAELVVGS